MHEIGINEVEPSNYDVIIAGSGAGGLLTALALSAENKRVLVIEKKDYLGGVWHGYNVNGYRVDQGLHVITRIKRGAFARFIKTFLNPPPKFILHEGWYFYVHDRVGSIPTSIGETLRWPLTGMRGRLGLLKIGAKIKTMKLKEMQQYKDITFYEFMKARGATNQVMLDVMQSAIYMAAGVPITKVSAYEALRTLRDTDRDEPKLKIIKKIIFGSEEYDEGYVIGGMSGLLSRVRDAIRGDYVLNATVEQISEEDGKVHSMIVNGVELEHSAMVSNIPLWSMPDIIKSSRNDITDFFERWCHMRITKGVTLWLGLDKIIIGDRKNRVIVHPNPNRWIVSVSSFDPTAAPEGKELIAIAAIRDEQVSLDEQVEILKSHGFEKYFGEVLDHIEMEHVQSSYATRAALIPGQTDLDRPGPTTPIEGLFIVGTDTAGAGVGLQQAANSAEGVVKALNRFWQNEQ